MLEAFYTEVATITVANSFTHDYIALRSGSNDTLSIQDEGVHFRIREEEPSQLQGQDVFWISAELEVTSYRRYSYPDDIAENDIDKEQVENDMTEDIRKKFGIIQSPYTELCSAGVQQLDYAYEEEVETSSDMTAIRMIYNIQWYDKRGWL